MTLQTGDYIIIRGYNQDNFFSNKHFRKLLNKPTRVWDWGNKGIYIAHPELDLVPLSDDVVYDKVIDSEDLPDHWDYKKKSDEFSKLSSRADVTDEKPLLKFLKKKNIKEQNEENLSEKDEKFLKIIKKLEDDEGIEFFDKFFGGIENYFEILSKKGLLNRIDPFNPIYEDYQNRLFYAFYENDSSFVWRIVDEYLSDIIKIGSDYYFDTSSGELSGFFNTSYRNEISSDSIESILNGEYDMSFWDVTDDVYRDVYDELTNENKKLVNERITSELKDMKTIGTYTELLEEIAQEQGRDDVELTDEVISRILGDDDTIEYLINKELDDIRSDLYSVYHGCYEGTLTDEWYDSLMSELVGFVIDDNKRDEYSYKKQSWDKEGKRVSKTFYGTRYKATKCVYEVVSEWLTENKDCDGIHCDTIEYFGSYGRLLKDLIDDGARESLRVPRLDDYPNSSQVDNCINYSIGDYF